MKRDLEEETKARKRLETNMKKFIKTRTDMLDENLMWSHLDNTLHLSQYVNIWKGPWFSLIFYKRNQFVFYKY